MSRCDLCFKEKGQLQPVMPKSPAKVCKGCFYEIDRIIGFLEHYGANLQIQGDLPVARSKSKPPKKPFDDQHAKRLEMG